MASIKDYTGEQLGLVESIHALRRKEVSNIQSKVQGPLNAHLMGNSNLELDIKEAIAFLTGKGYQVERFKTPS